MERTDLLCALALDGDEEASTLARWIAQRCGEVRAAHYADLDVVVLDERETDGVLLASDEALRAIDRIEGPHACRLRDRISMTRMAIDIWCTYALWVLLGGSHGRWP